MGMGMGMMAKSTNPRHKNKPCVNDSFFYLGIPLLAFILAWFLWSLLAPNIFRETPTPKLESGSGSQPCLSGVNLGYDPPNVTFYDDPQLSYSIEKSVPDWDRKRQEWLDRHPSFAAGARDRVVMVTSSQSKPCENPIGDHLLLRCFKNKVDYCRIHGYEIFYNNHFMHPNMPSLWAKLPVVKAAMVAHPEAEWIWWVDSDAMFTDMEFRIPLERYKNHNFVVHGWAKEIYEKKSWLGLNSGLFLIRNCQWSMDFMVKWANMGPMSKDYAKWNAMQLSLFDKLSESNDQSALVYLMYKDKSLLEKVYLEGEYDLSGYWLMVVPRYDNITEKYAEIERGDGRLRRRHAEKVTEQYGAIREPYLKDSGNWRRSFVTHFTGCQPCSGNHNPMYPGDSCWNGMVKALNFADNQVLRKYGFVHSHISEPNSLVEMQFDYPEAGAW